MMNEQTTIAAIEVDRVPLPRRARVDDAGQAIASAPDGSDGRRAFDRKRDYLQGFLAAEPPVLPSEEPGGALHEAVLGVLKEIYDPEIPVNIYDLGLIYDVAIDEGHVTVTMTLTTPHCPVAETMPGEVELRVASVPGVGLVTVNLVWSPPWDSSRMTDEARLELGML